MVSGKKRDILFVSRHYEGAYADNLSGKFASQASGARDRGYGVTNITISDMGVFANTNASSVLIAPPVRRARLATLRKLQDYGRLFRAARKLVKENSYDAVYVRSAPPMPEYFGFLRRAKRSGAIVVVEIPTYPFAGEEEGVGLVQRSLLRGARSGRSLESAICDLYTVIGQDVGGEIYNRPAMNINNGIEVSTVPARVGPAASDAVHIIGLASMCRWHGYDRVISGMAAIREEIRPVFHLVGSDGDGSLRRWKQLVEQLDLGDNVIFEGVLKGDALNAMVNRCHLAVGSLGLHRIGINSASTLKSREYMARGIPFVYSSPDPTLGDGAPGCKQLSGGEGAIDMLPVLDFVLDLESEEGLSDAMRDFALRNLGWGATIEAVMGRVERLRSENCASR